MKKIFKKINKDLGFSNVETHGHSNAIENILKDILQFFVRKKTQ